MYPDLHEHLEHLEREGLLIRVKDPVDKDQEMHPLVRWQFRGGIKERDRKAFLFEKPVDAKGRHYDIPVAIGQFTRSSMRETTSGFRVTGWMESPCRFPLRDGTTPHT
jgi:3-polyprenyl-4-hydroxybenzoate decarboxylase